MKRLFPFTKDARAFHIQDKLDVYQQRAGDLMRTLGYADRDALAAAAATHADSAVNVEMALLVVMATSDLLRHQLAMETPDPETAARLALELGESIGMLDLVMKENPIFHGAESLETLEKARNSRKRKIDPTDVPKIKQDIDSLHARREDLKITDIRRQIGRKYGVNEKTIRTATGNYDPTK